MATRRGPSRAALLLDLLMLAAVAALLFGLHEHLSSAQKARLAFRQSIHRPETFLTAAYLHIDDAHLAGNLVGYAAVSLWTYALCVRAGERRWFHFTTLAMLGLVPILANASSTVLWETVVRGDLPASRGFSGVVAAFGGFLAVALLVFLRGRYGRSTVQSVGFVLLFVVLAELLVIYADSPPILGAATIGIGILLVLVRFVDRSMPGGLPERWNDWAALASAVLAISVTLALLSVLVVGLFPVELVQDGSVTNVFAHASGLVWGVVVSRWGYRYWGTARP